MTRWKQYFNKLCPFLRKVLLRHCKVSTSKLLFNLFYLIHLIEHKNPQTIRTPPPEIDTLNKYIYKHMLHVVMHFFFLEFIHIFRTYLKNINTIFIN